ncbi:MAG: hydrocarbon-binding protein [Nostocaceae cyanobacterium]|nr:hydrocarbon-binding protein [Nostocaceae cyanobacterium]
MLRPTLGDFTSITCFKAVMMGMEAVLGEGATAVAFTTAGRMHGKNLIQELGLSGSNLSLEDITHRLAEALGKNGTRLCIVEKIVKDANVIKVYTSETICSAGEPPGCQRKSTYTLGVIWGALEEILSQRLLGKQTESLLTGSNDDVFEFWSLQCG